MHKVWSDVKNSDGPPFEIDEIQKFSRLPEQAGESNNICTVNCIFVQKSRHNFTL